MLYWKLSFYELVSQAQLKLGAELAKITSFQNSMVQVLGDAFGDGKSKPVSKTDANLNNAPTFEAALSNINMAFTF